MITVTCTTENCGNQNYPIELDVASDSLVICGVCNAVINGTKPKPTDA